METVEGSLLTEQAPLGSQVDKLATLWFRIDGLLERFKQYLANQQDQGPKGYAPDIEELLDRVIKRVARERSPEVRIEHSEGGGGRQSWQKWILGIVSVSLVGMLSWALGKLDTLNQEVATLQATQTMGFAAMAQRQTADEQRLDRVEARVYRSGP